MDLVFDLWNLVTLSSTWDCWAPTGWMCGHTLACLDRLLLKLIEVIFTTVGIISGSDQGWLDNHHRVSIIHLTSQLFPKLPILLSISTLSSILPTEFTDKNNFAEREISKVDRERCSHVLYDQMKRELGKMQRIISAGENGRPVSVAAKSWQKQTVHKKLRKQADRASEGALRSTLMAWTACDQTQKVETVDIWKPVGLRWRGVLVSYVNSWRAPRRHNTMRRKLQRAVRPCKPMPRHA